MMSVPPTDDLDNPMDDVTDEVLGRGDRGQIGTLLPDLNVTHDDHGSVDDRALLPYLPQEVWIAKLMVLRGLVREACVRKK